MAGANWNASGLVLGAVGGAILALGFAAQWGAAVGAQIEAATVIIENRADDGQSERLERPSHIAPSAAPEDVRLITAGVRKPSVPGWRVRQQTQAALGANWTLRACIGPARIHLTRREGLSVSLTDSGCGARVLSLSLVKTSARRARPALPMLRT